MRKHGGIKEILETKQCPGITGTRDSFGIGRNFIHQGKEITNYKEWEKAGYGNVKNDTSVPHDVKEKIKEKIKKCKRRGDGKENRSPLFERISRERPKPQPKKPWGVNP